MPSFDTVDRCLEMTLDASPASPGIDVTVHYVETKYVGGKPQSFKPHPQLTTITDTTPTVILTAPTSGNKKTLTSIDIENPSTTDTIEATIMYVDDEDETIYKRVKIAPEDNFEYVRKNGCRAVDKSANLNLSGSGLGGGAGNNYTPGFGNF